MKTVRIIKTILSVLVLCVFINNGAIVKAEDDGSYTLNIYDYDSDVLLASAEVHYNPSDNVYSLGFGWLDPGATEGGTGIIIDVHENTRMTNIWVDREDGRLYIEVSGASGTQGNIAITVPRTFIHSRDDVKIQLDNQSIEFTIDENGSNYVLRAEYTHSTRTILVEGIKKVSPAWYTQPLYLALIVIAIVAAIGTVYWFRFRR